MMPSAGRPIPVPTLAKTQRVTMTCVYRIISPTLSLSDTHDPATYEIAINKREAVAPGTIVKVYSKSGTWGDSIFVIAIGRKTKQNARKQSQRDEPSISHWQELAVGCCPVIRLLLRHGPSATADVYGKGSQSEAIINSVHQVRALLVQLRWRDRLLNTYSSCPL